MREQAFNAKLTERCYFFGQCPVARPVRSDKSDLDALEQQKLSPGDHCQLAAVGRPLADAVCSLFQQRLPVPPGIDKRASDIDPAAARVPRKEYAR